MLQPLLLVCPSKSGAPADGGPIDVLLRVQAPDRLRGDNSPSPAKRLALVIDRSGSMRGEPIREALRCAQHVASHLEPSDEVSLVVYDSRVEVLAPLQPVTSSGALPALIGGLECGGSTDLFAGWEAGALQLADGPEGAISRVILLSDGQTNHGQTDERFIEKRCREWAGRSVSTTTVGLGRSFNEDLLVAMARAGRGQCYYGQSARDLYDSFDEELALLQALYLRRLHLSLVPAAGVLVEMLSPVDWDADGSWRLPDLAWGAEAWVVLRLHATAGVNGALRDLLAVSLSAQFADGVPIEPVTEVLSLKMRDADGLRALPSDDLVSRRLDETAFAAASLELRGLAQAGDIEGVHRLLEVLERRFGHHVWLRDKVAGLSRLAGEEQALLSKEAMFSSLRVSRRLVPPAEAPFRADETELALPAYLRRKTEEGRGRKG